MQYRQAVAERLANAVIDEARKHEVTRRTRKAWDAGDAEVTAESLAEAYANWHDAMTTVRIAATEWEYVFSGDAGA